MVQWGNLGLLKAVKKFDPNRGVRFSTYAWKWINSAIFSAFYKSSEVQISKSVRKDIRRIQKTEYALMVEAPDKRVTNQDIAERLGLSVGRVNELRGGYLVYSMDKEYGDENDTTFHDIIPDSKQDVPKLVANRDLVLKLLSLIEKADILERIKPLIREVLVRTFGITDCGIANCYAQTIPEIAEAMGISQATVSGYLKRGQRILKKRSSKLFA